MYLKVKSFHDKKTIKKKNKKKIETFSHPIINCDEITATSRT